MWILEHETLFDGKKVWLKPGSRHLIGRTHAGISDHTGGRTANIDSKLVSRKHIVISVSRVPSGDGTKLYSRSTLEIADSSKFGTSIDGAPRIKGETVTLSGTEHTIQLGSWPQLLRIKWHPVVFTYATKETPETRARSAQLHALDIKTSTEFVYNQTTHVVSSKRNLPRVLQGLLSGIPIVMPAFLEAVIQATTSSESDEENYRPSQLEMDFEKWWPDEAKFIPGSAKEPIPRASKLLEPDPSRSEVFSGLTFVFLDEKQYQSLADPISGGGGKALSFAVRPRETTVQEYVDFVRSIVGKKRKDRDSGRLPVITVRLSQYPADVQEWAMAFVNGIDRALNQRSILQNEFLDAIIMKDPSSLQRTPPEEIQVASSLPEPLETAQTLRQPTAESQSLSAIAENQTTTFQESTPSSKSRMDMDIPVTTNESSEIPTEVEQPTKTIPRKRPFRRGATASRFTGFDDYEPPAKSRRIQEDSVMSEAPQSEIVPDSHLESQQSQGESQSLFVSQRPRGDPMPRKEPTPPVEEMDASTQMDEILPVAAAIKKRRLETQKNLATSAPAPKKEAITPKPKSGAVEVLERLQEAKRKVSAKEIDVREQVKMRTFAEQEARQLDEENLRKALEGVDISQLRGLAQVEEMEVPVRSSRSVQGIDRGARWNDDWNGRKNFKKFRRRGTERGPHAQRILVALEEVPTKRGPGQTESYFLEDAPTATRSNERNNISERGTEVDLVEGESEPERGFTRRKGRKGKQPIVVEDSGPDDEEILPEEIAGTPRNRCIADRIEETQVRETQRAQNTARSQVATGSTRSKRAAPSAPSNPRPAKKTREASPVAVEDSDEGEGGFRFRRRRR